MVLCGVFQEWGCSGDLRCLGIHWHVPTAEEKSFATEILQEFLVSEFDTIQQHVSGTKTLTRYTHTHAHIVSQGPPTVKAFFLNNRRVCFSWLAVVMPIGCSWKKNAANVGGAWLNNWSLTIKKQSYWLDTTDWLIVGRRIGNFGDLRDVVCRDWYFSVPLNSLSGKIVNKHFALYLYALASVQ